ncbi:MAG TPA: Gfo/Idh/MocA family oxidoreductase, partial [Terriglobia bacterium]|nr:Gfo/Idh/MocA family oxidoreductase [Terriglobia bacterium]
MKAIAEAETFSASHKHERPSQIVRVAVAGATGYAGLELLRLLSRHPNVRVARLMSSGRDGKKEFPIEQSHPSLRGIFSVPCQPLSVEALPPSEVDVVFLATPHQTALEIAPQLLERKLRVVDLSAAFRLNNAAAYPRWYGFEH